MFQGRRQHPMCFIGMTHVEYYREDWENRIYVGVSRARLFLQNIPGNPRTRIYKLWPICLFGRKQVGTGCLFIYLWSMVAFVLYSWAESLIAKTVAHKPKPQALAPPVSLKWDRASSKPLNECAWHVLSILCGYSHYTTVSWTVLTSIIFTLPSYIPIYILIYIKLY